MRRKANMAETLRQAIRDSGISGRQLARDTGVPQAVFSLFLSGKRSITIDTADKIASAVGIELRPVVKRKKGG